MGEGYRIYEEEKRTPFLVEQLLTVWENSVRATYLFLSESEIYDIRKYVPQALKEVGCLVVAENASGFPLAKGFYEHMGFQVYKRTELDEQGNPYPLLYMRLD